MSEATVLSLRS